MKRIAAILVLVCGLALSISAEDRVGFQIQVYVEPNEENSLYVNVLPVMYEFEIGSNASVKLGSVFSLRFAETITIGNVGVTATVPYYFGGQPDRLDGFYAGPNAIVTYNLTTRDWVLTGGVEAGYSFYSGETVSWVFGAQLGASAFFGEDRREVLSHFGPQVQVFF